MKFKKGDYVKLTSRWTFADMEDAPKWGGVYGYIDGIVDKVFTGDHNPALHCVHVKWSNGKVGNFDENSLAYMSADERDIAADFRTRVCIDRDIWVLVKTESNNFSLNVIESNPTGAANKDVLAKFVSGVTRLALPSVDNSDYNLTAIMLGSPDWTELRTNTLWAAASHIFRTWDLPDFDVLPLPLPEFNSIREAADTAPKVEAGAISFFHLPRNLVDYCDTPPLQAVPV